MRFNTNHLPTIIITNKMKMIKFVSDSNTTLSFLDLEGSMDG